MLTAQLRQMIRFELFKLGAKYSFKLQTFSFVKLFG